MWGRLGRQSDLQAPAPAPAPAPGGAPPANAGVEQDQRTVGAELHPSSWWLVWTSSAGDGIGGREKFAAVPSRGEMWRAICWSPARSYLCRRPWAADAGIFQRVPSRAPSGHNVHNPLLPATSTTFFRSGRRPHAGVEQDQGRVGAELHQSSCWLVWTSSAGDGIGGREKFAVQAWRSET
ncbi:uncharacterized protein LOC124654841 [Lolium rigidum]|uniref:uncharacterized protein LOC124654841 n=1 Tax=Lolium rigidum TaxID=89674 RepID=UPI001F5D1343|nr:uncharacterized protein LOC124654841 [Lolium rigidum]